MFKPGQILSLISHNRQLDQSGDVKVIGIYLKENSDGTKVKHYTFKYLDCDESDMVSWYVLERYYQVKPINYNLVWNSIVSVT